MFLALFRSAEETRSLKITAASHSSPLLGSSSNNTHTRTRTSAVCPLTSIKPPCAAAHKRDDEAVKGQWDTQL